MTARASDSFEQAAIRRVAGAHPDADLDALRASFDLIRLATLLVQQIESRVHRPAGWSMAGFRVMFCVWVAGELEPREIARFSGLSRAAVSSALNTLERDGLIDRHRESTDRRLVTVRLTSDGERRLGRAYREQNVVEQAFFGVLPARELDAFVGSIQRLLRSGKKPAD